MIDIYKEQQGMKLWPNATQMGALTDVLIPNMEKYLNWENGKTRFDSDSSKEKEGAWEFIKYVLSDEAQDNVRDVFSVNRKVMQNRLKEAQTPEYADSGSGEQEPSAKAGWFSMIYSS